MAASLILLLAASLSMAWPVLAGEVLPDPTRPALDGIAAAGTGDSSAAMAASAHAGLQSIIISPQRRAAVINGTTVEQGGKIGDDTLIEVRKSSVLLRNAKGVHVLELFPGVSRHKPFVATDKSSGRNARELSKNERSGK